MNIFKYTGRFLCLCLRIRRLCLEPRISRTSPASSGLVEGCGLESMEHFYWFTLDISNRGFPNHNIFASSQEVQDNGILLYRNSTVPKKNVPARFLFPSSQPPSGTKRPLRWREFVVPRVPIWPVLQIEGFFRARCLEFGQKPFSRSPF